MFLSGEKNQKTLTSRNGCTIRDPAGIVEAVGNVKVFCFFFSKKKALLT